MYAILTTLLVLFFNGRSIINNKPIDLNLYDTITYQNTPAAYDGLQKFVIATKLKANFKKSFPVSLQVTKRYYYVADGYKIFKFSKKGELINTIIPPKDYDGETSIVLNFTVYEQDDQQTLFCISSNRRSLIFTEDGKTVNKFKKSLEEITVDQNGSIYSNCTDYDAKPDNAGRRPNKIVKISPDGSSEVNLAVGLTDVGQGKMIVKGNSLVLGNIFAKASVLLFPCDTVSIYYQELSSNALLAAADGSTGEIIGIIDDMYVFRKFYIHGAAGIKDLICYYDSNLQKVKHLLLNVSDKDVPKEVDIDAPNYTGNNYACYNNKIYFLRNSIKGGTYIAELVK